MTTGQFTPQQLEEEHYSLAQMYWQSEQLAPPWRLVGSIDVGGGYDWDVFLIYTDGNVYYWWAGAGCSCNSPLDNVYTIRDLPQGSGKDALTDLMAWAVDENYPMRANRYLRAISTAWFEELQKPDR